MRIKKAFFIGCAIAVVVITASLFVPLSAFGQEATQRCPISIIRTSDRKAGDLLIFRVDSRAGVKGIVFRTDILNKEGQAVQPSQAFTPKYMTTEQKFSIRNAIESGNTKMIQNKMIAGGQPVDGRIVVWAQTVQFDDGSVWADDGSHSCRTRD